MSIRNKIIMEMEKTGNKDCYYYIYMGNPLRYSVEELIRLTKKTSYEVEKELKFLVETKKISMKVSLKDGTKSYTKYKQK